jgi:diguanylate cyclase (GGDEF)-like protein
MVIQQKTSEFRSIRYRILLFSVLVTLVPTFGMGWYFYDMTYMATVDKTEQKMIDAANSVEREINLWFKERDHDLRVLSNSSVVSENLTKYLATAGQHDSKNGTQPSSHIKKIVTYLTLVKNQYNDYRRLFVLDNEGQLVAAGSDLPEDDRSLTLPSDWKGQIETLKLFLGEVYFRENEISPMMLIGIPVLSEEHGASIGVFVVEIRLWGLLSLLKPGLLDGRPDSTAIRLANKEGLPILSTNSQGNQTGRAPLSAQEMSLISTPHILRNYINTNGKRTVGIWVSFKNLPWGLVIQQSYYDVFAEVIHSRDRIILTAVLFTLIIGLSASAVARQILIPLEALTQGVLRVANGELDISLDIKRNDELGIVTGMFNTMVKQLKQSQQELKQLATTDALTKLVNRKQVMTSLMRHVEYYRRYSTEFSILMIDIDHFKDINDTHGHLAGDAVLFQMARIFLEELRTIDVAGRYGGEEFLIILGQTDLRKAMSTAERIRQAVELYSFVCEDIPLHITISIGVSGTIYKNDTDSSLISRADKALYQAKASGRNRVVLDAEVTSERSLVG